MPEETSRMISSILSDNIARSPAYGLNSTLYIPSRPVAVKTGTTNDYKDAWIVGYTPNLVIGAWVGNNENISMEKKVAGFIVAPLWRELMDQVLPNFNKETFEPMSPIDPNIKPILRGDFSSIGNHSILYFVDKDNPLGPTPMNPSLDPQFENWEKAVSTYVQFGNTRLPTETR